MSAPERDPCPRARCPGFIDWMAEGHDARGRHIRMGQCGLCLRPVEVVETPAPVDHPTLFGGEP